jgi:hypothetical protein
MRIRAVQVVAAPLEPDSQTVKHVPDAGDRQRVEPFTSCPYGLKLPTSARLFELIGSAVNQVLKFFLGLLSSFVLRRKKRACARDQI